MRLNMLTINRNNRDMAFSLTYCFEAIDRLNSVWYNDTYYYMFRLDDNTVVAYNDNKADGTVCFSPLDVQDTFDRTILIPLSK